MEKFIITKEIIQSARDYLPIGNKEMFAKIIAEQCVVPCTTAEDAQKGKADLAIPTLYREHFHKKQLLLMDFFLQFYFKLPVSKKEPFNDEMYDYYAGSHIFEQLERMKPDKEVKDKVYDLMADYKDFKRHVESAIFQKLNEKNDTLSRFSAAIQLASDPEYIQKMVEELKQHADTLADHAKETGEAE